MDGGSDEQLNIIRKMGLLSRLHSQLALGDGSLHRSQLMLLVFLRRSEGPVNPKDIASRFEISRPAITVMINRLQKMGMIERTPSTEDQRSCLISLTEKGMRMTDEKRDIFRHLNQSMVEGIDDNQLDVLSRVLDRMIENLRNLGAPEGSAR